MNNRSNVLFKPQPGRNVIRIVPFAKDKSNPFIELYFHYLGKKTYLSPVTFNRPDPIAEFADKLRETNVREDWIAAKNFTPKLRTFTPIIVRGKEQEGVKFWSFGKTVYEQLLAIINDPDWGDITDPKSGRDINLDFTPQEKSATNYAESNILVKPNPIPLTSDPELMTKLLTEQPDIFAAYEEPSYDALKLVLERYLNPEEGAATETAPAADSSPVAAEASVTETSAPVESVAASVSAVATKPSVGRSKVETAVDDFDSLFNS
jgi:hypothetical protein